ncbi:hypothetical protein [Sphingomonas sp.]|uniref:hypothetical protein n=1 Tax=Sphingomonas sp. TaxID=28214 RepID=UPI002DD66E3A|nr:hypothetical protein [Sphingomonas sp.]
MVEDNTSGDVTPVAFARAYDWFKHMTGIALISIGGVFAFLDGDGVKLDPKRAVIVIAFLGLSGVTSLLMSSSLAGLETKPVEQGKLARRVKIGQATVTMSLSIGLGAFIQTFLSAMFP